MLRADEIDALRDSFITIAEPVESWLLRDLAERVAQAGALTSTAEYEVWRLQNLGLSQAEIKKKVAQLMGVTRARAEALFQQAAGASYRDDITRLPTLAGIPFEENEAMQRITQAAVKVAGETLENMTQTLGMVDPFGQPLPLQQAYYSCTNFAFQQVITGAADYQTAVRRAVNNLAKYGLQTIDYQSGVRTSLEAAIRRNMMGGLGLMQEQMAEEVFRESGADGWEISAHAMSAPDHEPIQGLQYSDADYKALNDSLVRRIGTLNCGHVAFPIILGVSEPQYTKEELEAFRRENAGGVTVDGRRYTLYQATQKQRAIERELRRQKRKVLVAEASGDKDKALPEQIRLQTLRQDYKRFSKAAGLKTQDERHEIALFGHKEAARAEKAVRQHREMLDRFQARMLTAGYKTEGFDRYFGDEETLENMASAYERMHKLYPAEAEGVIIRWGYDRDTTTYGWYDRTDGSITHNKAAIRNWKSLQKEYDESVQDNHFPKGTDARSLIYHEFGHRVWFCRGGGSAAKQVKKTLFTMGYGYVSPKQRDILIIELLSKYGAKYTNPSNTETIAEAFSEWYNSANPRSFCAMLMKEANMLP